MLLLVTSYLEIRCFSSNNVELYKLLVKELAQVIERQFSSNAESRAAGMLINTMGWIEGQGYEVNIGCLRYGMDRTDQHFNLEMLV